MLKLKLQYFGHLMWRADSFPWCWERLKAGEEDDRGWDGWMASLTRCTWVWASSRSRWWTGKPGVLQSMGSQGVGQDWATALNWHTWPDKQLEEPSQSEQLWSPHSSRERGHQEHPRSPLHPAPLHLTAHPLHQTTAVELGSIPPMLSFRAFMLVCLHTEMPKTQIHTGEWHPKDLPSSLLIRVFNPLSVLLFISPGGLSCDHPTHTKPNPEANAWLFHNEWMLAQTRRLMWRQPALRPGWLM